MTTNPTPPRSIRRPVPTGLADLRYTMEGLYRDIAHELATAALCDADFDPDAITELKRHRAALRDAWRLLSFGAWRLDEIDEVVRARYAHV